MSAVKLAAAIREQRITAEHAVGAYVKRIREVNSLLNLVVKDRFAAAIAEAKYVEGQGARAPVSIAPAVAQRARNAHATRALGAPRYHRVRRGPDAARNDCSPS